MRVAGWIREALSRAERWVAELERLRAVIADEPRTPARLARTVELAEAIEHIDPDRSRALALYLALWREGDLGVRARVLELARELRAYLTVAEVAIADHDDTRDPECLVTAGRAFVDAGLLDQAAATFLRASAQHTSLEAAIAGSPRLVDVRTSIARTRLEALEPEHELAACMARAEQAREGAAGLYLQAARIARIAGLAAGQAQVLGIAARRCPDDPEIALLFEDVLLERANADELLAHHRQRVDATRGADAWVERMRAAACELVLRNIHPGLGLRLLRTSLEHAYAARLTDLHRHLATWELLAAHARTTGTTLALLPLLAEALAVTRTDPDADLDTIYLARLGLEVALCDAHDREAAGPFAAALLERVPGHPLAAGFVAEVAPAPEPPPAPPPVLPAPELPTITFRIPVIKPAAVVAAPPPPAPPPLPAPPPSAVAARTPLPPRAPRKVVPVDVVIELPTGAFFSAVLRDLSTSGAFVATRRAIDVGTVVALDLRLPVAGSLAQQGHRLDARIVRRTDLGCGLAFIAPSAELVAGIAALIKE